MTQIIADLDNVASFLPMQVAGNTNTNGTTIDLATYKGPVTFVRAVGQTTTGLGASHLNFAYLKDSADNTTFTNVTGGAFAAVVNTANASNAGLDVLSLDIRALKRYVMAPIEVSGTNANVPVSIFAIAQKERI